MLDRAIGMLGDLLGCLELKMSLDFEETVLEVVQYAGMLAESQPHEENRLAKIEGLFKVFMAYPMPEVRERILRRLFLKLRAPQVKGKAYEKSLFAARFVLRKGVLNQLINGLLINRDIAETEESKLQMSLGTLIVKAVILAFNECQGASATSILPSLTHLN